MNTHDKYQILQEKSGFYCAKIVDLLSPEKLDEYIRLQEEKKSQQELEGFLNQHVPQAQEVFTDAFREFRDMYLGNVAASRNAPESTTDQTN